MFADLSALRALAHQHAEALRAEAKRADDAEYTDTATLRAASSFLDGGEQ